MTPCKFQLDAAGRSIMIYSEDRTTVFAVCDEPEYIRLMCEAVNLDPLSKSYAMAELQSDGKILLGENLPEQQF